MVVTVSYDYAAGGWPASSKYEGSRTFSMNVCEDDENADIHDTARQRAYRDCEKMMGGGIVVKIKNLTVTVQ